MPFGLRLHIVGCHVGNRVRCITISTNLIRYVSEIHTKFVREKSAIRIQTKFQQFNEMFDEPTTRSKKYSSTNSNDNNNNNKESNQKSSRDQFSRRRLDTCDVCICS